MNVGAITDIGKVREINEDSYYILEQGFKLYIVADGMGGHNGGEIASAMAIDYIQEHVRKFVTPELDEMDLKGILFEAFRKANHEIYKKSLEDEGCEGMGTTVTLALIVGNRGIIGHIGDSRAYLIQHNEIKQITEDHSLVAELVRNGSITEGEARRHPQKNIITRALGCDEQAKVDIFSIDFNQDEALILCSDGLSNFVDPYEIKEAVLKVKDSLGCCKHLVNLANQRGGYDNITVLIAKNDGSNQLEGR